jgi:HlyD family secretion protein
MDQGPLRRLIHSLRQSAAPDCPPDDDGQLLRNFLTRGDQNAFELLLWRHGPMVLGVCRRLLANPHDAEDAFQATFLALVKKAGSITAGAALGSWLYRVACRVALRLRAALARRARREQPGVEDMPAAASVDSPASDLRRVLDEEVNRLPARHRAAFVLCCLEGKSGAEAARELGCPPGTVSSRLTRAREQLRRRLARRGLAPSAAFAVALAGETGAAPVSAGLVRSTLEAARLLAAGKAAGGALSEQALTLAEGVVRAMSLTRFKVATLVCLVVGLLLAGLSVSRPALDASPGEQARQDDPARADQKPKAAKQGKGGPVSVRVIKPQPGGLERVSQQTCTMRAFAREDVYAAVPGVLKHLTVDIGSVVKKGQLLAEIDAPLLALEEKQAEAAVKQARGQVREGEARLVTARAEVEVARGLIDQRKAELGTARANKEYREKAYKRIKLLGDRGTVDVGLVDEALNRLEDARARADIATAALKNSDLDLKVKQGKVAQAEAGVETTAANLVVAETSLEKARHLRRLTRVVSSLDGVVTRRNYDNGSVVGPAGSAGGIPLLTIQRTDLLRVVTEVPALDVPLVEPGTPVEVTVSGLPGVRLSAKVSRVGFVLDEKTRTMHVEVDVPNPKQQLRPGMYGVASLRLKNMAPGVLRVPSSAITHAVADEGEPVGRISRAVVYVVRGGKAHRTRVECGATYANSLGRAGIEILSGLRPTDLVVLNPDIRWGPAVPVEIKEGGDSK